MSANNALHIAVLAGDGIGPEVMAPALEVLRKVEATSGLKFRFTDAPAGANHYRETGKSMPDSTVRLCDEADAILLGACGMALLGIVPLLSLRFPTPVQTEPLAEAKPEAGNWLRGLRVHPFLLRYLPLMALWAAILNSFPPFANVYLSRQLHTPLAHIGVIFSSAQVLQFFMGLVAPAVLRWLGLVNGIVAMLAFMGVALGAMDAAGHGGLTIAFYLAFAGTQWMSTSGLYSLLIDEVPDKDLSTASAMTMFCSTLAGSAATAGAGILFTRFGYPVVVAGIATLALVTAVLFRLLLGQAKGRTVRHPELTNELLGRTD